MDHRAGIGRATRDRASERPCAPVERCRRPSRRGPASCYRTRATRRSASVSSTGDGRSPSASKSSSSVSVGVGDNSSNKKSRLNSCSSSEVAAMIEGVLRHCTEMNVDRKYVDFHRRSRAPYPLLSPSARLRAPASPQRYPRQKLYRPEVSRRHCDHQPRVVSHEGSAQPWWPGAAVRSSRSRCWKRAFYGHGATEWLVKPGASVIRLTCGG